MDRDRERTAALHLWPEQAPAGAAERAGKQLGPRRLPVPKPLAFVQALAQRQGRIAWEKDTVEPLMEFRRAALGEAASGEPRALVRVDEFPHAGAFDSSGPTGTEAFRRFHAVLAEAGVPYLLAITPRVSREYLDPAIGESRPLEDAEVAVLQELRDSGTIFGLHGADHRTRHAEPRRHSEFTGLSLTETAERLDGARASFAALELPTPVFVPPFNRFDAAQYPLLAERFEVVCGGPESVRLLGYHRPPAWHGGAVYLPSYAPLYGTAAEAAVGIERMSELGAALWAPITLHWGWEQRDEFAALHKLCAVLAGRAADWTEFLTAVAASRRTAA